MPEFKFPKTGNKFAKNLVRRYRLVPHLDQFFSREENLDGFTFALEGKTRDFAWHPSGDATPTVRDLYDVALDRLEGQTKVSFSKAFPVGHFWHQLCQFAVVEMELAQSSAIERRGFRGWGHSSGKTFEGLIYKNFHYCTGMADVAPLTLPGNPEYVVDFKTMNGRDYGNANTPMPPRYAEKYEAQLNIYMDFFDIEYGLIVAIQKDSPHDMKEFLYRQNRPLIDAIYEKWHFVSECLEAREEPTNQDSDSFSLDGLYEGPIEED